MSSSLEGNTFPRALVRGYIALAVATVATVPIMVRFIASPDTYIWGTVGGIALGLGLVAISYAAARSAWYRRQRMGERVRERMQRRFLVVYVVLTVCFLVAIVATWNL